MIESPAIEMNWGLKQSAARLGGEGAFEAA